MNRRSFFSALASIGAGTAVAAAPAVAPAPSRGLELVQVFCPRCSWTVHPMNLGFAPPYVRRELLAPQRIACGGCGHEYTAQFVREV